MCKAAEENESLVESDKSKKRIVFVPRPLTEATQADEFRKQLIATKTDAITKQIIIQKEIICYEPDKKNLNLTFADDADLFVMGGHGFACQSYLGWPNNKDNPLRFDVVAERLVSSGLPVDFNGNIYIYSCQSAEKILLERVREVAIPVADIKELLVAAGVEKPPTQIRELLVAAGVEELPTQTRKLLENAKPLKDPEANVKLEIAKIPSIISIVTNAREMDAVDFEKSLIPADLPVDVVKQLLVAARFNKLFEAARAKSGEDFKGLLANYGVSDDKVVSPLLVASEPNRKLLNAGVVSAADINSSFAAEFAKEMFKLGYKKCRIYGFVGVIKTDFVETLIRDEKMSEKVLDALISSAAGEGRSTGLWCQMRVRFQDARLEVTYNEVEPTSCKEVEPTSCCTIS